MATDESYSSRYAGPNMDAALDKASGVSNKNLLHNWDFRNPINQRGQSSYTSAGYTIDRWVINGGTQTVVAGVGVKWTSGNVLYQISEKNYDTSKIYTFSYMDSGGNIYSAKITSFGTYIAVSASIAVQISANILYISGGDSSLVVAATKLELGSVSTLANDSPADFGEELRKCQWYYIKGYKSFGVAKDTTFGLTTVYVNMRTTPGANVYAIVDDSETVLSNNSLVLHELSPQGACLFYITSGTTVGKKYRYVADLSADL